jgi:hypothetical protein
MGHHFGPSFYPCSQKHPRNHHFGNDDHHFEFTVTFLLENGPKSIISHNDGIILFEMMTAFYLPTTHPVEWCGVKWRS